MNLGLWTETEKCKTQYNDANIINTILNQQTLDINGSLFDNWMSSDTSGSLIKINSYQKKQVQENIDPWTYPEAAFLNISLKSACFKDNCLRLLKVECKKKKKIWLIVALLYLVQIFQCILWKYLMLFNRPYL